MAAAKPEVRHNSASRPDRNAITFPIPDNMDRRMASVENVGATFGISLLSSIEAELFVSYLLPVIGSHL